MVVSTSVVARRYEDVSAGTPISVDIPAYEAGDVYVYYGKAALLAAQGSDYTVALAGDFNTFTVTPTAAFIAKIDALIATDDTEENYITVRRKLDYTTDATPDGVRYTPYTSREFDRTSMRFAQLAEALGRAVTMPESLVAAGSIALPTPSAGRTILWNDDEDGFVEGPSGDEIAGAQASAAAAQEAADAAQEAADAAATALANLLVSAASEILARLITVDGPGSELDADKLDGQHKAFYLDAANLTGDIDAARLSTLVQDLAAWQAGASTTAGLVSPAHVKAAIDALAPTQVQAAWQAGASTTAGLVSPAHVKAAIDALAPTQVQAAWVNFNGTGTVAIRASHNVSSITDLGTGVYQVNLATAMPDANYAPVCTGALGATASNAVMTKVAGGLTASYFTIYSGLSDNSGFIKYDADYVYAAVFGS